MIDSIIADAWQRLPNPKRRGFEFVCYCIVCAAIRRIYPEPGGPARPPEPTIRRVDVQTGKMAWTEGDVDRLKTRVRRVSRD